MRAILLLSMLAIARCYKFPACLSLQDFSDQYGKMFAENSIEEAKKSNRNIFLFSFEKEEKILGQGSFGIVKELTINKINLAVKKVEIKNEVDEFFVNREISYLKKLCGQLPKNQDMFACKTLTSSQFQGCVYDTEKSSSEKQFVYLILERLEVALNDPTAIKHYQEKSPLDRARIMKKIADKFSQIHVWGIIHSDIKPENIMATDKSLSDFRIIDFGVSVDINTPTFGGSRAYCGNERTGKNTIAKNSIDVYSLAISFAVMEESFDKVFEDYPRDCYFKEISLQCDEILKNNIGQIFDQWGLQALKEVILKAAAYKIEKRYFSMNDFSSEINKVILLLESEGEELAEKNAEIFRKNRLEKAKKREFQFDRELIISYANGRDLKVKSSFSKVKYEEMNNRFGPREKAEVKTEKQLLEILKLNMNEVMREFGLLNPPLNLNRLIIV